MKESQCALWVVCLWVGLLGLSRVTAADWEQGPGGRRIQLTVAESGKVGFTLVPAQALGITFTNLITERRHLTNQILLNGSGVAAGDVDGDGWCDLYFCSIDGRNGLYRNLGDWQFEDITEAAGVACAGISATGAAFADLDGDGALDLIVNSVGEGTHVFRNDGRGHFTRIAQLNGAKGGMSLALADIDGDGYLDLYIANYRTSALMDIPNARATFKVVDGRNVIDRINGRPLTDPALTNRFYLDSRGAIQELGEADEIYRNLGGTRFAPISFTSGQFLDETGQPLATPPFDWGLSVMFRDINADGLPDIYVCNDFDSPDRIWINQGGGRFRALPRLAMRKSSLFSMGMDFADINRDGWDDFFVLDMLNRDHVLRMTQMQPLPPLPEEVSSIEGRPQYMVSTLFLNQGDGAYAEIGQLAGLEASDWAWSPIFLDVDLNGWEDLLVANGHERAARDLDVAEQMKFLRKTRRSLSDTEIFQARRAFPRLATGNLAFRNKGDLTFEEVGQQWGFHYAGVSQGMALADLDNDGDLEVIVNTSNDAPRIYRNETGAPRLAVRLKGMAPNSQGTGARIKVLGGAVPVQTQEILCGGRYLSCDQAMRVFAAGTLTNRLTLEVQWRSGRRSLLHDVKPNSLYEIDELSASPAEGIAPAREGARQDGGGLPARDRDPQARPVFEEVSERLDHTHVDDPFNDFGRQSLLPNRLSQLGPGVSWCDLNRDGWDDLIIGSGKGGRLAVYTNDTQGGFQRMDTLPFHSPVTRDQTTVLGWSKSPAEFVLLAGSANYEDGLAVGASVRSYVANQKIDETIPASRSSTGPLAMADIDGDGDLDLFVGGRVLPGNYPAPASSRLFRNQGGKWQLDAAHTNQFDGLGLVSGAVFSDLDGDGDPDLILACDWGPVRVFQNHQGRFTETTESLGLAGFLGWWNGVATGDFNNDGLLDIVASNWGRNTKYESHRARPLKLYYGDFDGDGTLDIIEAYDNVPMRKVVPERQLDPLARAMPFLRGRFSTHRSFAEASVQELLENRFEKAHLLEANWLESTVFLNRGDHFEARPLPFEAQMAPAFGVCVGDLDGDGNEDIFLAQNFFATHLETPRYDGGRGLWLKGDGQGGFAAVPARESGLAIYGEQRGCALGDYDRDGRLDLVVTQNGAATKLYRNVTARPGLRVQLQGPEQNPLGIGAVLRLAFGERLGPAREIQAGSGYWSQDSACQVMALPEPASALLIRWPGGKQTTTPLPSGARAVRVSAAGQLLTAP